jgi:CrcB protein
VSRFGVVQLLPIVHFPWPTLLVNVLGSLLIGILIGAFSEASWFTSVGRPLLVTGLLGGFTTFSAFSLEAVQLAQAGHAIVALGYVLASVALCVIGAWLGIVLGKL